MNGPSVTIRFEKDADAYRPGDTLAGEYRISGVDPGTIKVVEVSVLWYSEGKGDEDMAVHEFWRLSVEEGDWIDPARPTPFSSALPATPLSYDGLIVKIRWCVRVRVFLQRGKDVVGQKAFRLGDVPPAEVLEA